MPTDTSLSFMIESSLPTRRLGPGGPLVGAIGLGCMGMSWAYNPEDRDDERSMSVIRGAIDLGVTLIDTADVYGPYTNEKLVGKALEGRRDEIVLATKCGLEVRSVDPMEIARNGRPEHVRAAIDASLERLGTDRVDLYQLHRTDPDVPVEETWGAMAEVVAAGKARAIGMSEATVEELEVAQAIHPVASVQSEFSLWERGPIENGVLVWCREHDAAFIPFSPLGRGFLTGHVTSETITAGDMRGHEPALRAGRDEAEHGDRRSSPRVGRPPRGDPGPGRPGLVARAGRRRGAHTGHAPPRAAAGERGRRPPRADGRGDGGAGRAAGAGGRPLRGLAGSAMNAWRTRPLRHLVSRVLPRRPFALRFWDGTVVPATEQPAVAPLGAPRLALRTRSGSLNVSRRA